MVKGCLVTVYDNLAAHLAAARAAPFLFVGSGLSRRYLGLETWPELLKRFAAMTGKPYGYYFTSGNGDLPAVASAIAEAFHDLWWEDDRFAESRALWSEKITTRESPLKVEIARHTSSALADLPAQGPLAAELALLGEAVVDGVITTNYDPLPEHVFSDYRTYVGQDQLLFSGTQGVGEIYKIHGGDTDPDSLVLTSDDYARFQERNPYLAAKLLAIFVEHPVVFLGYSLSDPNVTGILVSVARVLTSANLERLQDRLLFVRWDPSTSQPTFVKTAVAVEGFTIPVIEMTVADFEGVFTVLGGLRRQFPARLLRQLKEHVYDLVLTSETDSRLYVQDISADMDLTDLDVVFGVGMVHRLSGQGYIGLTRRNLLLDVLRPASEYEPRRVVDEALPVVLRGPGSKPINRYLRGAGLLDDSGALLPDAVVDARVTRHVALGVTPFLAPKGSVNRGKRLVETAGNSLARLIEQSTVTESLNSIAMIPHEHLDLDLLRQFLDDNKDSLDRQHSADPTAWAKLVCLYDYYRYGQLPQAPNRDGG